MSALEMNFDGLVGPTHNYAGLSYGNVASTRSEGNASNPREGALEGIRKMAFVAALGLPQGWLPPQERPHLDLLRALGFSGPPTRMLEQAAAADPALLAAVWSASPMWAANAATVTPSADAEDGRVHLTPANLVSTLHRSLEGPQTARMLRRVFPGPRFAVHQPLPATPALGDEGAANHTRFHAPGAADATGLELFVYGRRGLGGGIAPQRFPARQTLEACDALVRRHGVRHALRLQQRASAIDAGVFHNDVIAVGSADVLLWHEAAFEDPAALGHIEEGLKEVGGTLRSWRVEESELSVEDAVRSYLFNSQLLATNEGMVLVAPREVEETPSARAVVQRLCEEGKLAQAHYLDVRQSMRNGGGPACLRLRVSLSAEERTAVLPGACFDAERAAALEAWAQKHYRDRVGPADLVDPQLVHETREALDALTVLMGLGGDFYDFQRA